MMGEQRTPGPWFFDRTEGRIFQRRDPLTKYVIAEIESSNDADGHLIAAAPELLGALQGLEGYLRSTPHHNVPEAALARKVIAKARGA